MTTSAKLPTASVPRPLSPSSAAGWALSRLSTRPRGIFHSLCSQRRDKAERGFKAGDAVGRVLKLDFFFVGGVGRVVGGDGVNHAVENGLDHGVAVGRGAQGRIHFGVGVVETDVLFGQQEVVRRDFACDAQAVAARLAHGGDARQP